MTASEITEIYQCSDTEVRKWKKALRQSAMGGRRA
jgi:hypothetical protein